MVRQRGVSDVGRMHAWHVAAAQLSCGLRDSRFSVARLQPASSVTFQAATPIIRGPRGRLGKPVRVVAGDTP